MSFMFVKVKTPPHLLLNSFSQAIVEEYHSCLCFSLAWENVGYLDLMLIQFVIVLVLAPLVLICLVKVKVLLVIISFH